MTAQFLGESTAVGFLGALAGTTGAVLVTVGYGVLQQATPIMDPLLVLAGPPVGALAGAYPASKAARVEPVHALRG